MKIFSQNKERLKRLDERYEVSDQGLVYSGGLPLESIGGVGVNIHGQRRKIAYLVARAFVPNEECRPYVRHKNGDVQDNRAENLEWSEEKEEKRRGPKPEVRPFARYSKDGERLGLYSTVSEAAEATGLKVQQIRAALNGRVKTAGGFLWVWL